MVTCLAGLTLLVALVYSAPVSEDGSKHVDILMPGVQPQKKDTYLCYGKKVTEDVYLTGFQPHAHMQTAHHMLMFGCESPGLRKEVWNCGEMQSSGDDKTKKYPPGSVCQEGQRIIYAWGSDAPELKLPEGVGFKVGPATPVKYIVLQVHYKNVDKFIPPKNGKDESGVTLNYTKTAQPKLAGVYMMGTGGELPPNSVAYFDTACSMTEDKVLHPFAFRVHAHGHGVVNSAYRVRDSKWKLIGSKSPQKPQMFYDVDDKNMTINNGDLIAMRCTMKNDEKRTIPIGATQNDEMCNFYIMYYVDSGHLLKGDTCWAPGPPVKFFGDFGLNVKDMPLQAITDPDSGAMLKMVKQQQNQMGDLMKLLEKYTASLGERELDEDEQEEEPLTLQDVRNLENLYQYYADDEPARRYVDDEDDLDGYEDVY